MTQDYRTVWMIEFMEEMANYWSNQAAITREDSQHWAAVYNQKNCLRIAEYLYTASSVEDPQE